MRILITAGGTREYIDPVRFISNASSGQMGYALAHAALKAGQKVILITAPTSLLFPNGAKIIEVETAAEMFDSVKKYFDKCNCLIMAAAVADYTPVQPSKTKIKKSSKSLTIKLKPTVDILKWAGKHKKKNQIIVGFALEEKELRTRAEKKFKDKNLDMIIANTPAVIGSKISTVQIKTSLSGWIKIANKTKTTIARTIIKFIESLKI